MENRFILAPNNLEGNFSSVTELSGITVFYYYVDNMALDAVTASCAKVKMSINDLERNKLKVSEDIRH